MIANFAKMHARIISNLYYVPILFSTANSESPEIEVNNISDSVFP